MPTKIDFNKISMEDFKEMRRFFKKCIEESMEEMLKRYDFYDEEKKDKDLKKYMSVVASHYRMMLELHSKRLEDVDKD